MKELLTIIAAFYLLSSTAAKANDNCRISLIVKTKGAKTHYLESNGESLSKRTMTKLSSVCKFQVRTLKPAEKNDFEIRTLQRKLNKLKKKGQ